MATATRGRIMATNADIDGKVCPDCGAALTNSVACLACPYIRPDVAAFVVPIANHVVEGIMIKTDPTKTCGSLVRGIEPPK